MKIEWLNSEMTRARVIRAVRKRPWPWQWRPTYEEAVVENRDPNYRRLWAFDGEDESDVPTEVVTALLADRERVHAERTDAKRWRPVSTVAQLPPARTVRR